MSTLVSLGDLVRREMAGRVDLTDEQLSALASHYSLLLRWNEKINLTTITELSEAAVRHYCESLFLGSLLDGVTVVDVGSGAGFPGIPIAIMRPDWTVTLVESHKRKAVFLREAARALGNVRVIAGRAEAVEQRFDWAVSRAVDPSFVRSLRLADRFGLLLGSDDAARLEAVVSPIPWGDSRVVAISDARFTWNQSRLVIDQG